MQSLVLSVLALVAANAAPVAASSGGAPLDRVGIPWPLEAPVECTFCHSGFVNAFPGGATLSGAPAAYQPKAPYRLLVRLIDPDPLRAVWGFELAALRGDLTAAGALAAAEPGDEVRVDAARNLPFLRSNALGKLQTSWSFDWTAPAVSTGDATLYLCGNAGNGSGDPFGDHIFCSTLVVPEIACTPPLGRVRGLEAAHDPAGLAWSWDGDPLATQGYRLYAVAAKTTIAAANGSTPAALRACAAPTSNDIRCVEVPVAADPDLLFYQVVSVCAAGLEGPN